MIKNQKLAGPSTNKRCLGRETVAAQCADNTVSTNELDGVADKLKKCLHKSHV